MDCKQLIIKYLHALLQKMAFRFLKGSLLASKRLPFAAWKVAFCWAKGCLCKFHPRIILNECLHFGKRHNPFLSGFWVIVIPGLDPESSTHALKNLAVYTGFRVKARNDNYPKRLLDVGLLSHYLYTKRTLHYYDWLKKCGFYFVFHATCVIFAYDKLHSGNWK